MDNDNLRFVDICCGIGGFHQAFARLGATCVLACDTDAHCRAAYLENYGLEPVGDVAAIDLAALPEFDVLCAGFPCQPFAKCGAQQGYADARGQVFFRVCDIARARMPAYMIMENVRNLASHDGGNTWRVIRAAIDELGYYTYDEPLILNVIHFNVPQNRERVVIMCKRKDLGGLPELPTIPKHPKSALTRTVADIVDAGLAAALPAKMAVVEDVWHAFVRLLVDHNIAMPKFPLWTDWWGRPAPTDAAGVAADAAFYAKYTGWIDKNREFYGTHRSVLDPWLSAARARPLWAGAVRKFEWQAGDLRPDDGMDTVLWCARSSGVRVKRPDYTPTLVAMNTTPVFGPEHRFLTPRELLRLQSFPDTFVYNEKHIHKQVGNAVNVDMIERCVRFLLLGEALFRSAPAP